MILYASLTCTDQPDNVKRGGACMNYKENLSLKIISTSYFDQCLLCEVTCQNQKGYVVVIYCSPNQLCNKLEDFLFNLEKLKKPKQTNQVIIYSNLRGFQCRIQ